MIRAILLTGMMLASTLAARADADGPDYFQVTGVAEDDVLNIREAPEAGARKIGEIPSNGDRIQNLGCQGGMSFAEWEAATDVERAAAAQTRWCRISYRGVEGWAAGRFLAEGSYPADDGLVAPGPGRWRIAVIDGKPAIGETEFLFLPDGAISGSTGCNRFQGKAALVDGMLVIEGPFATTRMACPGEGLTEQEDRILSALGNPLRIAFDPFFGTLELVGETSGTLKLEQQQGGPE